MSLYTYKPILIQVQDACQQLNLTKPAGVYDSQDENSTIMGAYANLVGPMLQDVWEWQQFYMPFSVTGDGTQTNFPLPENFSRFTNDTGWSLSKRRPVIIMNQAQWAAIKSWLSQSFFVNPACMIMEDTLQFMTAPADGEEITFEYTSKFWVIDGTDPNVFKEQCTLNSDTPMHDSVLFTLGLKIKWLEARGMTTAGPQQDFNERFTTLKMRNNMAQQLSLNGGSFTGFRYMDSAWNAPDTNYGGG